MLDLIPRRAFFQFEIPIHYLDRTPRIDAEMAKWGRRYLVPPLIELEDDDAIADVYWAWNENYFFAAFDVPDLGRPPACDPTHWWKRDGLRLCIDTRDTRDLKRATRFCHFFYLLPVGGGPDRRRPIAGLHRMSKAKEPTPAVDLALIKVAARVHRRGYALELALPAACLNGWDPAEHPRIGVFYKVKDEQGDSQHLTVSDELGWNSDPSTWATGVLVD
jgi:hypothetical protein